MRNRFTKASFCVRLPVMEQDIPIEQEMAWWELKQDTPITEKTIATVLGIELSLREKFSQRLGDENNLVELGLLEVALPIDSFPALVAAETFFQRNIFALQIEVEKINQSPSYTLVFPPTPENRPRHRQAARELFVKSKLDGSLRAIRFIQEEIYQKYHF